MEATEGCFVWVGSGRTKGLAIFSYGDYRVTLNRSFDPEIRWAAPVSVTGPTNFFLVAIWNMRPYKDVDSALAKYRRLLNRGSAVVAGDFNGPPDFRRRGDAPWAWGDPARQRDANFCFG